MILGPEVCECPLDDLAMMVPGVNVFAVDAPGVVVINFARREDEFIGSLEVHGLGVGLEVVK